MESQLSCQLDIFKEKFTIREKDQLLSKKEIMKEDKQNFKNKSINKRISMIDKKRKIKRLSKNLNKKIIRNLG
jgi:hypothetical protein